MRTALLELLVVFSVRDVALKKTALPRAGSLFAFLIYIYIYIGTYPMNLLLVILYIYIYIYKYI